MSKADQARPAALRREPGSEMLAVGTVAAAASRCVGVVLARLT